MAILDLSFEKSFAQGFFTSCIPASACVGALLSSRLLNILSRKQFFYIINAVCILGILLIQTKSIALIILGRLFQGLLIGIGTAIVPLYIKEFIPEMNGKYGLYNQLLYTIGIVWGFLFNLILHSIFENP
jgi:MFS family permease